MPYLENEKRKKIDEIVRCMVDSGIKSDGELTYLLYKFCKCSIKPSNYKNFLGELNECQHEIRRRLLVPYQDKKIQDNGDVDDKLKMYGFFED